MFHSKIESKETEELFSAMMQLESVEEFYKFFDDLCTYGEVQAMTQRYQVAKMLEEKKTYNEISAATGASTATITRVNKALNYGPGGYRTALSRQTCAESSGDAEKE